MENTFTDIYIAEKQIRVTNAVGYVVNFLTVWKNRTVSFSYDKLTQSIINISYQRNLEEKEVLELNNIACNFLGGIYE